MKNIPITKILKEIYLFSYMDDEELEKLTEISSVSHFKKDSYLFMQGETSDSLLILIEGLVSVFKHDEKGNDIIIGLFKPFSMIAEPAILKGLPFPSSAVFKSDGAVLKVKLEAFKKQFMNNPHVSYEIIQSLLDKIQLLQQNIHFNIATTAKDKILHFYSKNQNLGLELKQYEVASLLGMSAETLSRNCKQLIKENKLTKVNNQYQPL